MSNNEKDHQSLIKPIVSIKERINKLEEKIEQEPENLDCIRRVNKGQFLQYNKDYAILAT